MSVSTIMHIQTKSWRNCILFKLISWPSQASTGSAFALIIFSDDVALQRNRFELNISWFRKVRPISALHDFQLTWTADSIEPCTTHKYPIDESPVPLESWISWLNRIHFTIGRIILYYSPKTRNLTEVRVFWDLYLPQLRHEPQSWKHSCEWLKTGAVRSLTFDFDLKKKMSVILVFHLCAREQSIWPKSAIFDTKCVRLLVKWKSRYFDVRILHDMLSVCGNRHIASCYFFA